MSNSEYHYGGIHVPNLLDDFQNALSPRSVDIITFAESEEFCGKSLYPRQKVLLKLIYLEELDDYENSVLDEWIAGKNDVKICPMIRERIAWCKENGYSHFRTIQFVGGRRSGKGLMTSICIAKKVWDLVQTDDPAVIYGIDPDKDIYLPILAAKQEQAKAHQYGDAAAAISSCKALQRYVKRVREEGISIYTPSDIRKEAELRARGVDYVRDIAKIRVVPMATSADTVRGSASILYAFDEFAHGMAGDSRRSGDEVWSAAVPSLAQFGKHAQVFANSSPYTKTGKFYELYEDSLELEDGFPLYPEHLMLQFPSWEMYRDWETHSNKPQAMVTYEAVKQEEKSDPDKFRVEYRSYFAETQDAFLDPDRVNDMFNGAWAGRTLDTEYAGCGLWEYRGHADPSSTTANFGFAIGHVEYRDEVEFDPVTNERVERKAVPHVVFDLIDAFYPADMPNNVIDWEIVTDSIMTYIHHFRPRTFTFDQFDSAPVISTLRRRLSERNIYDCRVAEVTASAGSNRRRWDNFKAALYLGRVHAPNPKNQINQRSLELGREELKFLQERSGKVMKQDIGPVQTKDIADCIAEVTDALIGNEISGRAHALASHLQSGSQGGYRIGGDPFKDFYREGKRARLHEGDPLRGRHGRRR